MKSHENTDELLRRALGRYPRPVSAATLTDDIVRRATRYESRRTRFSRRVLLSVCWIAVAVVSWWIVRSLPLPAWTPEPLSAAATWLIPGAVALLAWRGSILRWLATACERLLLAPSAFDTHMHI